MAVVITAVKTAVVHNQMNTRSWQGGYCMLGYISRILMKLGMI